MPRRNRVDPWGDLHAVSGRGLFTGNRGCLVDDHENVVRHHGSSLWIICLTKFRDWCWPLARPRRWTPVFFLDEAVALAAGHRPCGLCRRDAYRAYRDAVSTARGAAAPLASAGGTPAARSRNRTTRRSPRVVAAVSRSARRGRDHWRGRNTPARAARPLVTFHVRWLDRAATTPAHGTRDRVDPADLGCGTA